MSNKSVRRQRVEGSTAFPPTTPANHLPKSRRSQVRCSLRRLSRRLPPGGSLNSSTSPPIDTPHGPHRLRIYRDATPSRYPGSTRPRPAGYRGGRRGQCPPPDAFGTDVTCNALQSAHARNIPLIPVSILPIPRPSRSETRLGAVFVLAGPVTRGLSSARRGRFFRSERIKGKPA